jgi:hypothetical protein
MNPDGYNFNACCPECQERRSVAASRIEIQSGNPVKVYAIACDHSWTLSLEETQRVRENMTAWAS